MQKLTDIIGALMRSRSWNQEKATRRLSPAGYSSLNIGRRRILSEAGKLLGGGAAVAALTSSPVEASQYQAEGGPGQISGLWQGTVSAKDNSFPPFKTFELYGGGIWISSGQTDLTPAALDSSLWGTFTQTGPRTFRGTGRFWTYDPHANPTGFGALIQTTTISNDGRTYHGEAPLQFFDSNGNALGPAVTILDDGVLIANP